MAVDVGSTGRLTVHNARQYSMRIDSNTSNTLRARRYATNDAVRSTLPTPARALTSEVQAIVDEIGAAASLCLNAGPNPGQGEIDAFTSHVNSAMAHYDRAQAIGAGASDPRPRPGLMN